jgi:hypothetical protein
MPPTIGDGWRGGNMNNGQASDAGLLIRSRRVYSQNEGRETRAPIAPATLLLLGLGSVAVGGTVYRNTKKRQ